MMEIIKQEQDDKQSIFINYDVIHLIRGHITNKYDLLQFDMTCKGTYACRPEYMHTIPSILLAIASGDKSHPWFALKTRSDMRRKTHNIISEADCLNIEQKYFEWEKSIKVENQKKYIGGSSIEHKRLRRPHAPDPEEFNSETSIYQDYNDCGVNNPLFIHPLWCIVVPRVVSLTDAQLTYVLTDSSNPNSDIDNKFPRCFLPLFSFPSTMIFRWMKLSLFGILDRCFLIPINKFEFYCSDHPIAKWLDEDEEERVDYVCNLLNELKVKIFGATKFLSSTNEFLSMDANLRRSLLPSVENDLDILTSVLLTCSGYFINYRKRDILVALFKRGDIELLQLLEELLSSSPCVFFCYNGLTIGIPYICQNRILDKFTIVSLARAYFSYRYLFLNERDGYRNKYLPFIGRALSTSGILTQIPNCCELLERIDPTPKVLRLPRFPEFITREEIPISYIQWYIKRYSWYTVNPPIIWLYNLLYVCVDDLSISDRQYERLKEHIIPCLLEKWGLTMADVRQTYLDLRDDNDKGNFYDVMHRFLPPLFLISEDDRVMILRELIGNSKLLLTMKREEEEEEGERN